MQRVTNAVLLVGRMATSCDRRNRADLSSDRIAIETRAGGGHSLANRVNPAWNRVMPLDSSFQYCVPAVRGTNGTITIICTPSETCPAGPCRAGPNAPRTESMFCADVCNARVAAWDVIMIRAGPDDMRYAEFT